MVQQQFHQVRVTTRRGKVDRRMTQLVPGERERERERERGGGGGG